jgi:hypothetical protein
MTMATPQEQQDAFIAGIDRLGYKLVGALARIFGSLAGQGEEEYKYGLNPIGYVDLTAVIGNQQNAQINITQEADFVAVRSLFVGVDPVAGTVLANSCFTAQLKDGGSDRDLQNVPIHILTHSGVAPVFSAPFAKNRLFRRNSTITCTFTNQTAVATRVWFCLWGYKVYDQASLDLVRRR